MADEFTKVALYGIKTFNKKVKEKIGIEKLIELLNEYHHFNSDLIGYFYDDEYNKFYFRTELPEEKKEELKNADALIDDGISEVRVEDERIISKKFGFIKWLVENEKIDRDKELKENGLFRKYFYDLEYVKNYDRLVMWLSVENEPINFLISILK